ncbi:MAG: hypothetical protein MJ240_09010 [Kiritimatiellae bacterium]|nr:hypothetical protein [Kiritimatiellia bacterium]
MSVDAKNMPDYIGKMSEIVFSDGFSDKSVAELIQIDDLVLKGDLPTPGLPADTMRGDMVKGIPRWTRISYLAIASTADDLMRGHIFGGEDEFYRQATAMKSIAERESKWVDGLDAMCRNRYGEMFGKGSESDCYADGQDVYKVFGMTLAADPAMALERIELYNFYFPEAALEMVGCGISENRGFAFLVKQKKFEFERRATEDERLDYMASKGFEVYHGGGGDDFVSYDGSIAARDMHAGNFRVTTDGKVVSIDACTVPNIPRYGLGGAYDYHNPPEHLFADFEELEAGDELIAPGPHQFRMTGNDIVGDYRDSKCYSRRLMSVLDQKDPTTISWQYLYDSALR